MRQILSTSLLVLLLLMAGGTQAWQGAPYGAYWPNAWPGQVPQPGFYNGVRQWGYGGPNWNMRGYMTEWGDMNVVIEYHGNTNNGFWGGNSGYPGYGSYPRPPYYGHGWR